MKRWLIGLIVILLLLLGVYWTYLKFYSANSKPQGEAGNGENMSGEESGEEVAELYVEGTSYRFTPSTLTAAKGSRVRLTFKNSGVVDHNFVIDELDVQTRLVPPGSSVTVEFDIPQDNIDAVKYYEFHCSVPGHRDLGMEGNLIVE